MLFSPPCAAFFHAKAAQLLLKTPLLFPETSLVSRKSSGVFVSSAQVQERHAKLHAGRCVETRTFSPRFAPHVVRFRPFSTRRSASSSSCRIFCRRPCRKMLYRKTTARMPRTPRRRFASEPPPFPPRKPQKARRCGSVDGLFRRVGQRLPTFFISGCVPRSRKCA